MRIRCSQMLCGVAALMGLLLVGACNESPASANAASAGSDDVNWEVERTTLPEKKELDPVEQMLANRGQRNPFGTVGEAKSSDGSDEEPAAPETDQLNSVRVVVAPDHDAEHQWVDALELPPRVKSKLKALVTTRDSIESCIELYKFNRNGRSPALLTQGWVPILGGDYLAREPHNPFTLPRDKQATIGTRAGPGVAWHYDTMRGEIRAVLPNPLAIKLHLVPPDAQPGEVHANVVTY